MNHIISPISYISNAQHLSELVHVGLALACLETPWNFRWKLNITALGGGFSMLGDLLPVVFPRGFTWSLDGQEHEVFEMLDAPKNEKKAHWIFSQIHNYKCLR